MTVIHLSENDISTLKYHTNYDEISSLAKKTLVIISNLYRGLHNAPYGFLDKFQFDETHCIEYDLKGVLATFDFDTLTRLVFLAHDLAVRVEIQSTRKNCVLILFHERTHEKNTDLLFHPTLEQAVEWWRK